MPLSESDNEAPECPLCLEVLDVTDRNFYPCPCGYQICLWCWHQLRDNKQGRCPACRTVYDTKIESKQLDRSTIERAMVEKKKKSSEQREAKKTQRPADAPGMESYRNVRVLQKNLLYVVGLPASACRDGPNGKREFFGKFGPIVKIAITPKKVSNSSYCAYVTYKRAVDAAAAMKALNKISVDGRLVRAAYGTTKYCSYFLRGRQCLKPGCLYLHELAKVEDCYTKDDLTEMDRLHALQQPTPAFPQPVLRSVQSAPASNSSEVKRTLPLTGPLLPLPSELQQRLKNDPSSSKSHRDEGSRPTAASLLQGNTASASPSVATKPAWGSGSVPLPLATSLANSISNSSSSSKSDNTSSSSKITTKLNHADDKASSSSSKHSPPKTSTSTINSSNANTSSSSSSNSVFSSSFPSSDHKDSTKPGLPLSTSLLDSSLNPSTQPLLPPSNNSLSAIVSASLHSLSVSPQGNDTTGDESPNKMSRAIGRRTPSAGAIISPPPKPHHNPSLSNHGLDLTNIYNNPNHNPSLSSSAANNLSAPPGFESNNSLISPPGLGGPVPPGLGGQPPHQRAPSQSRPPGGFQGPPGLTGNYPQGYPGGPGMHIGHGLHHGGGDDPSRQADPLVHSRFDFSKFFSEMKPTNSNSSIPSLPNNSNNHNNYSSYQDNTHASQASIAQGPPGLANKDEAEAPERKQRSSRFAFVETSPHGIYIIISFPPSPPLSLSHTHTPALLCDSYTIYICIILCFGMFLNSRYRSVLSFPGNGKNVHANSSQLANELSMQNSLRAILPNVNISFSKGGGAGNGVMSGAAPTGQRGGQHGAPQGFGGPSGTGFYPHGNQQQPHLNHSVSHNPNPMHQYPGAPPQGPNFGYPPQYPPFSNTGQVVQNPQMGMMNNGYNPNVNPQAPPNGVPQQLQQGPPNAHNFSNFQRSLHNPQYSGPPPSNQGPPPSVYSR